MADAEDLKSIFAETARCRQIERTEVLCCKSQLFMR
jgi:hypothetical protein